MKAFPRTHDCRTQFLEIVARAGGARFFLFGLLLLSACDSSTYREVVEVEIPAAISLEPIALQLEEGADRSMTLVDSSKPRRPAVTGDWIAWSSSNPNVATVENGVVRAVGPGVTKLTARIGGTVATSSVRVVRTPTELEVRGPDSREAAVATLLNEPIEAVVRSAMGRPVAGAEVRFNVVAGAGKVSPVVAETDANGIARAAWTYGLRTGPQQVAVEVLHAGVAQRSIAGQAVAGPAFSVRVTPEDVDLQPGIPFQFSAEFVDLYGNFVSDAVVDWSTSNPAVVQVGSQGWATGVSQGEALVVARPSIASPAFSVMAQSPGNGRGNSRVTVGNDESGTSATIAIMSGNHQTGPVGQRLSSDLAIRVTDASGSGVRHQDVTWTVTSGSAVLGSSSTRTNPHGNTSNSLTLGSTTGPVTVTASAGSLGSVTFQATAEPGSVASLVITPGTVSMEKGEKRQFGFSARDQFGNAVANHGSPAWSTGNTSIATVTSDGTTTAISGGSTTIRASVDGVVGTGDLTVSGAPDQPGPAVSSVHASTKSVSFTSLGMEATVFAVARDGAGQVVSDVSLKWSSSNQGVATVSSSGKILSRGVGTALIVVSATCCEAAKADTVSVTVSQVATQISIDPGALSLEVGSSQGVKVSLKDANGHDLVTPGTTTWTSSDPAVMTVAASGMVQAVGAGSATLSATSASLIATAPVAVTDDASSPPKSGPTVASVKASTKSVAFTSLGMEATLSAVAHDGKGEVVSDESFKWSSTNQGVATVSSAGKIISKGVGTALIIVSATCCEAASADTVTATVTQVAKEISINPDSIGVKVGSTQGVQVTLKDANGHNLTTHGTTTWTSSNGAVMTVSANGVVKGEGAGSAILTATNSSLSTSTSVAVTADAPAPPPAQGGAAPLYAEDFSRYATLQDYFDGLPHRGWPRNEDQMAFENDGPPNTSGRAIRYTYPDATAMGGSGREGRCNGPRIGYDFDLRPLVNNVRQKEIWAEYWVKYSDNWTPEPPAAWGCTGNPDHKLVFGLVFGGSGRFEVLNGNNVKDWWIATPIDSSVNPDHFRKRISNAQSFWNNEWFQVRMHMKVSSSEGVRDGLLRVWINGELYADSGPWEINHREIWGLSLGRNRNHHAGEDMSVSFGDFKVWNQNPGW